MYKLEADLHSKRGRENMSVGARTFSPPLETLTLDPFQSDYMMTTCSAQCAPPGEADGGRQLPFFCPLCLPRGVSR